MGRVPIAGTGNDPWRGYDAAALLASSGDVSFLLSESNEVIDVVVPEKEKFGVDLREAWRGRAFLEIVAKDSIDKVTSLLRLDTKPPTRGDRWRHLNFAIEGEAEIPLLAKNFRVETLYGEVHQVVCRDLRPMTELNARWQNENRQLLQQVTQASSKGSLNGSVSALVGSAPLADIMAAAADEVARICIEEALRSCAGDQVAAALVLGITGTELRRRRGMWTH